MEIEIFGMRYDISAHCITGRRRENQDSFGWIAITDAGISGTESPDNIPEGPEMFVAAVCDGMGGMPNGGDASRLVIERTMEWVGSVARTDLDSVASDYLEHALPNIEEELMSSFPGSGTTVSLLLGMGGEWMSIHIGDSRLYAIYRDGSVFRTEDHSPVEEMRKKGFISEDEMECHPMKNLITYYVGGDDHDRAERNTLGDWVCTVLCSDGAYGSMPGQEFIDLIRSSDAEGIVDGCYDAGSSDNITVIRICRVPS